MTRLFAYQLGWPGATLAHFGLANTLYAQNRLEEAIVYYHQVLDIDRNHMPARNNLADSLLRLGRCESARVILNQSVMSAEVLSDINQAVSRTQSEIEKSCLHRVSLSR